MKPSERNERNDQFTAWVVTIIVHLAVLAALFFMAIPHSKTNVPGQNTPTETQSVQNPVKVKPKA